MKMESTKGAGWVAVAKATRYPVPDIPALTPDSEIDIDALGSDDLETYVKYPDMQPGDVITAVWRGASAQGEPFDQTEAGKPVTDPDPDKGFRLAIKNTAVAPADGGWAFYSYYVNSDMNNESLRRFCFIGLRDRPVFAEQLTTVQVLQSHALVIDHDTVSNAGATLLIPPYQAMQVGDQVTVVLNGTESDGTPIREKTYDCSPQADDLGHVLACDVRSSDFRDLLDGMVTLHYTVELAKQAGTLQAPEQCFEVRSKPAPEPMLPAPSIVGFTGGGVLDPDAFANGLTLQAVCPAQAMPGDQVLCHWVGKKVENRHILTLRLDASSQPCGLMQFNLDSKALTDSVDDDVEVFLQIARKGWAMSAVPLVFKVERTRGPRVAPSIEQTTADGAGNVVGSAIEFRLGAWVNVPSSAVKEGDTVKVHWEGDAQGGRTTVQTPADPTKPLRFMVPAEFIAANMEQRDDLSDKRFPVSYTLISSQGEFPSDPVMLRIQPVPRGNYQQVLCAEADGLDNLHIGSLTEEPHFVLNAWPYFAVGNQVTLSVSGSLAGGGAYQKTLRAAAPVTADEVKNKMVVARLALQDLRGLANNSSMTLRASISFDGGKSTFAVPDATLRIQQ
ncbi:hypothetical protein [Pseudomonas sp.]|uniref:hypothetical protein n=1 Tax=Pseudomonas sp. TaxID=306 RepID=UPI0028B0B0F1|nr:hypothetical protein [Pseudomonas sp.]